MTYHHGSRPAILGNWDRSLEFLSQCQQSSSKKECANHHHIKCFCFQGPTCFNSLMNGHGTLES